MKLDLESPLEFVCSLTDEEGLDWIDLGLFGLTNYVKKKIDSSRYSGFKDCNFIEDDEEDEIMENAVGIKRKERKTAPLVISPSGMRLKLGDIQRHLRKLEIGNPHQIEVMKAWEFYMLNMVYWDMY